MHFVCYSNIPPFHWGTPKIKEKRIAEGLQA